MNRLIGETRKTGVVVIAAEVLRLVVVGHVRSVERAVEAKRFLVILFDEFESIIAHVISLVALGGNLLAILHEYRILVGSAGARHRRPIGETGLGMLVAAHVPLARQAHGIAVACQDIGESGLTFQERAGLGADAIVAHEPILHAMMRRKFARQVRHTAGRAYRRTSIGAREAGAFGCQAV